MVEKFWICGLLVIWIDRLILLPSIHVQDSWICKIIIDLRLSIISWLILKPAVLNVHCIGRLLLINFLFFCNAISCSDRTTFKRKNLILKKKKKKGITTGILFLDWCHLLCKVAFDKLFSLWQCQTSPKLIRYFFLMWFSWVCWISTQYFYALGS